MHHALQLSLYVVIIKKYLAKPKGVEKLQTVQLDLLDAQLAIQEILVVTRNDRLNSEKIINEIFKK